LIPRRGAGIFLREPACAIETARHAPLRKNPIFSAVRRCGKMSAMIPPGHSPAACGFGTGNGARNGAGNGFDPDGGDPNGGGGGDRPITPYLAGFARRLRQARSIVEHNQAAVARSVGVTGVQWHRYETGQREMALETLAKFSAVYRVCPRWLVLGMLDGMPNDILTRLMARYPDAPEFTRYREDGTPPRSARRRRQATPAPAA